MGEFSIWHILVVGIVVLVLFGRGKVSSLMGEVGKGISAFKKGIAEEKSAGPILTAESQKAEQSRDGTSI